MNYFDKNHLENISQNKNGEKSGECIEAGCDRLVACKQRLFE